MRGGEVAVDEQRLAPVTGWVRTTGCSASGTALPSRRFGRSGRGRPCSPSMHRGQALQQLLDRRPRASRRPRTCWRTACRRPSGGSSVHVEDAAHRRLGIARDVGVPFLAGDVLGILVGLDDQDLGMALRQRRRGRDACAARRRAGRTPCAGRGSASGRGRRSPDCPSARRALPGTAGCRAGVARSTPWISAPMCGVSFSMVRLMRASCGPDPAPPPSRRQAPGGVGGLAGWWTGGRERAMAEGTVRVGRALGPWVAGWHRTSESRLRPRGP